MSEITLDKVKAEMKIPPELQAAYAKIIKAGLKVMFDKSTQDDTIKFLKGDGDMGEKIGNGVASVILFLFSESNQTMPPQLIIPAGMELIMHAADVAQQGGFTLEDNDIAEAAGTMLQTIIEKMGIDPKQLQTMQSGVTPQGV